MSKSYKKMPAKKHDPKEIVHEKKPVVDILFVLCLVHAAAGNPGRKTLSAG
jgi:hypothetical protein